MILPFLILAATVASTAVPLHPRSVCVPVGTSVVDNFDDVQVVPAVPPVNGVVGPTPTGTYLTYQNMAYANVGTTSNVVPPSTPNDIYVEGRVNNARIVPTSKGANAFKLSKFRYACIYATGVTVFEVSPKCTFVVTCNVFGGGTRSKSFSFTPDSLLRTTFNTGTFPSEFSGLTQCDIRLTSASVAGIIDSSQAVLATVLAIDNVENQGQKCI